MDDTLIGKAHENAGSESRDDRCSACGGNLEPRAIFCPRCGPPAAPDPDPEFDDEPRGEAYLKITVLVMVFLLVAIFKLDLSLDDLLPSVETIEDIISEQEKPKDEDFKVHHWVNAVAANVREKPSLKGKIVAVVKRGEPLEVLEAQGRFTKIRYKDKTGWISSKLLTSEVR